MKFMRIACLLGIVSACAPASHVGAQEPPDRRLMNTLTVTGSGESMSAPDIAYVTVGVVTTGARAQEAASKNAEATTKVMTALKALGIADKDIQTSDYNVSPQYEQTPQPRREGPRIIGYHVSNNVRATVRNLANIGRVIDAALEAGANNVHGVGFGLDAREKAESEALSDAVAKARRKADILARASGVRITRVVQIHEGQIFRPMPMMEQAMFRGGAAAATPISPGELTITANVTVVYMISEGAAGLERRVAGLTEELRYLVRERAALAGEIADLKRRYKGTHPTVRAKVDTLNTLELRIESLTKRAEADEKAPK